MKKETLEKMKRSWRMSDLVKPEIEVIRDLGNFTKEQETLFNHLCAGNLNDDGIMLAMRISSTRYYKLKDIIYAKAERLLHSFPRPNQ